MIQGVDTSSNNGAVDFAAVKAAGRNFAMIRVGYGLRTDTGFFGYISKAFAKQVKDAQSAGLDTGAYWYSYATTPEEARIEAQACLKAIAPFTLTYPVAFDQEYQQQLEVLSRQERTDICKAFLQEIEAGGYYAMIYASTDWFEEFLYDDQLDMYDHWVAQYGSDLDYKGEASIWQYSGNGQIEGVSGPIDLDVSYKNYPQLIREAGKNHLTPDPEPEPEPDPEPAPEPDPEPEPEPQPEQPGILKWMKKLLKKIGKFFQTVWEDIVSFFER